MYFINFKKYISEKFPKQYFKEK